MTWIVSRDGRLTTPTRSVLSLFQWGSYVLEMRRYVNRQDFIIFRRRDLLKGIGHNITSIHTHL